MISKAIDILQVARNAGVHIYLDKAQLQVKFPKGKGIDPQLLENIKGNKELIINFLNDSRQNSAIEQGNEFELARAARHPGQRIPLSFSQERLWFIDKLEGTTQYHMPAVLRLKGKLNREALVYALQQIVTRHEVVRTVFTEEDGQPYQHINTPDGWDLSYLDGLPYKQNPEGLKQFILQLISATFDLSKDFMLRANLITIDTDEHILVVTIHHIASDGWSKSVLVKEVVDLYKSYEEGSPSSLAPLQVQYADYAAWQRQYLSGVVLESKLGYWKEKLDGVATLQLPTDFSRPSIQSSRGATASFIMNKALSLQIKELSRQQGATLFMTLLTAYKVLLHRYSGQEDICVGSPIAGRKQQELEGLIGFFANTLVFRSEVHKDAAFTDLLQQVRRTTMEAQENQEVPFEKVVDAVVKERSLSRSPLAQVMFSLQNTPEIPELRLGEIQFLRESHEHTTSTFDLTFFINDTPNGLAGIVEYSTDLFTGQTIRQMMAHYQELLASIVKSPQQKIGELPMLTPGEVHQLLKEFNNAPVTFPKDKSIIHLFTEQVTKTPGTIALEFEQKPLTYQELHERSNQLAHFLVNRGVKEDTLVPICIERSMEMIIGILGIMKAGGAYVPVDPGYPAERISFMLEDTGASMVLTSKNSSTKLPAAEGLDIIELDTDWITISKERTDNVLSLVKPHQLAYIIYTSGSTGKPKGVMIEHRGVVSLIKAQSSYFNVTGDERIILFSNYGFDASVEQLFLALFNGASLVMFPEGLQLNIELFQQFLKEKKITHLHATPFFLENLIAGDYGSLKRVIAGGDTCKKELAKLWKDKVHFYNEYGPTETTVTAVEYHDNNNHSEKYNSLPIGKPLANVSAYILDKNFQLCPMGVPGELFISGVQVARGYLNRGDLTAEKFIPDPFTEEKGIKMYRTGDLCRWISGGNIDFLGRVDDQVKLRGYRIELGEIETILNELDAVSSNCVVVKQEEGTINRLVSYYVPDRQIIKTKENELYASQVASWKELYNSEYIVTEDDDNIDKEFDIIGWNDSFTREPIAAEQMQEWLHDIINVIMAEQPGHVLEIGCGTGLIYFQLAGKVKKYIGTDFSRPAVEQIKRRISKGLRNYGPTELQVCAAHEVDIPAEEEIDTIVLNSIVQYFPGDGYMTDVIRNSIHILKGKGRIIIGDIRDNRLLQSFKERLQLEKMQQSASVKEFKWAVDQEILREEELCYSPDYFYNLQTIFPAITHVDIQWKQSSYLNELTLYRYTVVIYVGIEKEITEPAWQNWTGQNTKEDIIAQLDKGLVQVALKNFPNTRLWKERQLGRALHDKAITSVGDLVAVIEKADKETEELADITGIARSKGYQCKILLDEDPLKVNLLMEQIHSQGFIRQPYKENRHDAIVLYTNIPLFTDISLLLQKEIRSQLQQRLPEYMVPAELIALGKLPLTNNGKVDRKFLSERQDKILVNKLNYQAPRTEQEQILCAIWQDLLRLEKVGVEDNFFELGGHSLLVTRLISAIRREMGVELPIKDIFIHATIADLSRHLESVKNKVLLPPVEIQQRPSHIPLSFSQERLWFVDRLEGSVAFHVPAVIKLSGKLNKAALAYALQTIVARHEVLRTIFLEDEGRPYQQILPTGLWDLQVIEGRYAKDPAALQDFVTRLLNAPFDLANDHMLRASVIQLKEDEHLLAVALHHIASDAWSLSIMVKEVAELYKSFIEERPAQLPTLRVQYADYAVWQRKYLQGELLDLKINYWKEKLSGVEPLLLPTDYSRPPVQSMKGTSAVFNIDKKLGDGLKQLSQQQESTLFMTMLAAFKVLLHRYSGQNDICVGTSIAGRQQQEVEDLIGLFVNILALRTQVDPAAPFTSLLDKVRQTTLEAYEYQEVPFERVVDAVVKERDISRSPLFQVLFVMLNTPPASETTLGEIKLSGAGYEHASSKYDITFFVTETPAGLSGSVEYSTELFSEQTIFSMMAHFNEVLHSIVKDPHQKITDLPLLSRSEERQLLTEFNDTVSEYPHVSIAALFEAQVARTPEATAVISGNETITYRELNGRANQLANYLHETGIAPGTNIGLLSYRNIEMIIAILGIVKAGCAYVPFNTDYPAERLGFIIEDAGIEHLLYTSHDLLQSAGITGLNEIHVSDAILSPETSPAIQMPPDACIYIMFTSGTTGRPKGIAVNQQNILKLVYDNGPISIMPTDRVLQWSNYSFDGSTYDIYSSLLSGASLCLIRDEWAADVDQLSKLITQHNISVCFITTALFNTFIDVQPASLKGMRKILFGGEMVSISHVKKALSILGTGKIVHVYGPTETTVYASSYAIDSIERGTGIPIGRPLSNTQFYVLNQQRQLVPVGVPGELYIGGAGVSLGYVNNAELTKEKFIVNPFTNDAKDRLYRTGDIVRWLAGGAIEYLSRIDDQVKIRGFRIELGEIESVLQEAECVRHAAVIARTDQEGTKRLIGYVVPSGDFDKQAIQQHLKDKLPDYMVPAILIEMEALPLNPNGKIDRKALPDPETADLTTNEFVAPRNHAEQVLAAIWQNLLDLDTVGVHDNFFEIGGDSLLAIRVVSAIRKQLEVEMPISNLFEYQTIATLAAQVETQSGATVLPPIQPAPRPQRIPLSFSQERLWFIDRLEGSQQYHIPAVMRLKGELNFNALEHALSELINRHEVLRTIFLEQDGEAHQVVKEKSDWQLPLTDGSVFNNDLPGLQKLIQQLITKAFDLSADNMLRADLVKVHEQEHILIVTLHHIASDGWSRSILVKEVAELYTAGVAGRNPVLAPLPVQYADFAIWQRHHLQGEILEKKLGYWKDKLQGIEPLQMPIDFPRPAVQTTRGGSTGFTFDKEVSAALQQLSQQEGSTLFMTLLAALKVLLCRYTSQKDICIGTGIAGRPQQEVEGLIGFFVNTLALRTELDPEESFAALLQRIRKTTLEGYENQEVPFEKVVDAVIQKRDRSRNPIFQVMFVLQNTPEVPILELGKLQLAGEGYQHTTAQFDLSFSITEYAHGLVGSLEYNTDLYTPATIDRLLQHFHELIISIVQAPHKKICDLSIMSQAEEQQVLFGFNANDTIYPTDKTIIALFEEQVALHPHATAVIFEEEMLTYLQLNEKANQLANYFRSKGVRNDTLVAISVDRSVEMMVGILGILKAGGAYVPIDAEYPAERIRFMLEDTATRIVVTNNTTKVKLPLAENVEQINLDDDWIKISEQATADLQSTVTPGSLAYIIYTSGSTGKPKGVMVTQQNVVSLVKEVTYVALSPNDILLSTGSSSFDATTLEYWGMLLNGGQLILCGANVLQDSALLKAEIDKRNVNRMWFTSSWFNQLVETHIAVFAGLETILVGGEKLSEHHIEKLRQTYPDIEIINGYGPTENTTFSLTYSIKDSVIKSAIPIGRPLNNRKAYVLDEKLQLVPVGVAGEICLGGAGLSKGYLNRPQLTAEKFVQHPFSDKSDEKIYKTGDIGRWLPDGNIEYLGRIDEQVKIRGYRIELGEIEAVLQQTDLINQAVVMAWQDKEGNKILVGYIVPSGLYNKNTLLSWLQAKLPDYMIPALWVELEHLPLTSNGKINKRALPDPDTKVLSGDEYAPPVTKMEMKLAGIWQDILRIQRVGIHDNFFELGGHSLLAMRLISAVRKELQVDLAVKELFIYPTIAALGSYLQKQHTGSFLPSIEAYPRPPHIPLSFSQERLWFIDQLEGSVQYNSPTVLRLKGKLSKEALTYALQNIVARHEVLRTVFHEADGKPYQDIMEKDNWELSSLDGSGFKKDRQGLHNLVDTLITAPFDLSKDYMLRAGLITLHEDEYILVVTMHHIASDGWSLPIIVQEVVESYSAFIEKRSPNLPQLSLQYADYAIWQRKYLEGELMSKKTTYWKKKLEGISPLQLPTDYKRPAIRSVRGASVNFMIDRELSDELHQLSQVEGVTLYMILLATYNVLLQRYSGEQDICVGASIANRPQQELEGLIGFFVNTLALRNEVNESATFTELLQQVKNTTLEAYEHQDVPFERVVEEVVKERDPGRSPLFQVMLVLLNTPESSKLQLGEVTLVNESFDIKISKFDFTFHVSQSAYGLPGTIVYNTDLFREDTILRMAGHFIQLLRSVVKEPGQSIDLLQMLTEAEEQQLLGEFN